MWEHLLRAPPDGLVLLVLFGSRARGDFRAESDYDLGYLADARFDPDTFHAQLVRSLGTSAVDLVDLATASGVLRQRVAAEGRALHERQPDTFDAFRVKVSLFWGDVAALVREGHEAVLRRLGP